MYIEYQHLKKYAKKGAEIADTPDSFSDAGYLLTENDLVVDIDTIPKNIIEKIISEFNIKTQIAWTDRGAHFQGFKKSMPAWF